jgi:hypothetical protein
MFDELGHSALKYMKIEGDFPRSFPAPEYIKVAISRENFYLCIAAHMRTSELISR